MATLDYRDARIYVDGYELSGDFDTLNVALSAETLDETSMGDTTRIRKGGLTVADIDGSGFWDGAAGHVDQLAFGIVGTDDKIITVFANGLTEGTATDKGFSFKGVLNKFNLKGTVAQLLAFDFGAKGRGIEA